jgi:hypothetical protein
MNNNEKAKLKLNQIMAHTQALIEGVDLNPAIDECVELLMATQVIELSLQVQNRMHELRISPEGLNLRAKVSKLELTNLLTCKSLPSLKALWSIAKALHCDLKITAIPSNHASGMRSDILIRPNYSDASAQASLSTLHKCFTQIVATKTGGATIFAINEEPLNSFFSTRFLFRSAVSRMFTLKLELQPTMASAEHLANVI